MHGIVSTVIACILVAGSFFMCMIDACALPNYDEPSPVTPVGINLSGMQAEDMNGVMVTNDMFSRYELTLIVVWVVWSGASDSAMRATEACKESLTSQNVNILGVYYEDEMHPVQMGKKYYEDNGYSIDCVTNRNSEKLDQLFDNTDAYLPVLYVVNSAGVVLDYTSGYISQHELNRFIDIYRSNMNVVRFVSSVDGSEIYKTYVKDGEHTYYPDLPVYDDYIFRSWDKLVTNITEDTVVTACYDKRGDANLDGKVNTGDAVLILKFTIGVVSFSDYVKMVADINRTNQVNTGDAMALLRLQLML